MTVPEMSVPVMHLGSCVLCRSDLDTFGQEVFLRIDARLRVVGYACEPCVAHFTGRLAPVGSDRFYAQWAAEVDG